MSNKDVYKNHITTYFGKNDIINVVEGFKIEESSLNRKKRRADIIDISNNIAKIKYNLSEIKKNNPENKEINKSVSKNYLKMKEEVGRYNSQNSKMMVQPHLYERIDDNGNLYEDLELTVSDARTTDSKEILLQQNTAYIIGSLVVSSFLIIGIGFF